ncbi:MAG: hypothetical protein P8171_24305 [Candidatus Thiodiazotropha sp.]
MTAENLYHFLLQSYLNPVVLLAYLLGFRGLLAAFNVNAFTSTGVNSERLNPVWYLLLAPLIYLVWIAIDFLFLSSFDEHLTINTILGVDFHWLQYASFLLSALTLMAYSSRSGMEGNIMGFIFAPLLFIGMIIYAFFHFQWVWSVVLKGGAA